MMDWVSAGIGRGIMMVMNVDWVRLWVVMMIAGLLLFEGESHGQF
jgi:hydrogenase/urease accessory protein HupE